MWKVLAESVEGTSHRRTSTPCQDHCLAAPVRIGGETVLIIACADGAGSAEHSTVGARVACDRFFDIAYERLGALALAAVERDTLLGWYRNVHDALAAEAVARSVTARDLACTLLTAIIGEERATFAQVGDGSIVFLDDGRYQSAFWPQVGEYANTTNFITQPGFEDSFEFAVHSQRLDELAVFTDGLQRLALSFATRAVHQAFFAPMFSSLRASEHADELIAPLRSFLDSASVNERTDDDKTLVLAARVSSRDGDAV